MTTLPYPPFRLLRHERGGIRDGPALGPDPDFREDPMVAWYRRLFFFCSDATGSAFAHRRPNKSVPPMSWLRRNRAPRLLRTKDPRIASRRTVALLAMRPLVHSDSRCRHQLIDVSLSVFLDRALIQDRPDGGHEPI